MQNPRMRREGVRRNGRTEKIGRKGLGGQVRRRNTKMAEPYHLFKASSASNSVNSSNTE